MWWPIGARHFLDHLVDGISRPTTRLAVGRRHGDRCLGVFNPVTQGQVRPGRGRGWVMTSAPDGRGRARAVDPPTRVCRGLCPRIVDHAQERVDALARLAATKERVTR